MPLNFSGGPPSGSQSKPTDPIKIFQSRPAIPGQINDLWQGQAEALNRWNDEKSNDVLISLNTGAGKSVVGVLICQSLLNKGIQNPVYVCATNDLVEQTAAEAQKLALDFTTKIGGKESNELYDNGTGFLITSYQTLINARSSLRGELAPGAVVFDDAHVGEPIIRGQFTLKISAHRHPQIHETILSAVQQHLSVSDSQRLRFVRDGHGSGGAFMCPPNLGAQIEDVLNALRPRVEALDAPEVTFPYMFLALHWHACAVLVSRTEIEISPPFLPARTLTVFNNPEVRRIYLSATLKSESEFVRAYGRSPGVRIEPAVDAGNGERTIVSAKDLTDRSDVVNWAQRQAKSSKILVAVPSKYQADAWQPVAKVAERSEFGEKLKAFRGAAKGGFVLAGRFDGIDLPDNTCRLMVLSGLPAGGSELETYLWQRLEMQNLLAARVATRITQLFGRIIRGRTDFGFFLVAGGDLTRWLARDRNLALLPELLQKQIKLGEHVQKDFGVKNLQEVDDFLKQVMSRDEGWLKYYRDYIDSNPLLLKDVVKRLKNEEAQLKSARAEAKFAEALWQRRYADALQHVEPILGDLAATDSKLAGWLGLWSGLAHQLNGNSSLAADQYRVARSRIPIEFDLPTEGDGDTFLDALAIRHASDTALRNLVSMTPQRFEHETGRFTKAIADGLAGEATSNLAEEAFRSAGTVLGFNSSRPDNDGDAGPDALWLDPLNKTALSFELKTDKSIGSTLNKEEVGQSHDHVQWVRDNYPEYEIVRHLLVGVDLSCTSSANPGGNWYLTEPARLIGEVNAFVQRARAIRGMHADAAGRAVMADSDGGLWSVEAIAERLSTLPLHANG